jgi:DNA-binding NarL/FixJ family response regulator
LVAVFCDCKSGGKPREENVYSMTARSLYKPSFATEPSETVVELPQQSPRAAKRAILYFDARALTRECFVQALSSRDHDLDVQSFASLEAYRPDPRNAATTTAVLVGIGERRISDAATKAQLSRFVETFRNSPVIVMSDVEDVEQMLLAFDLGARGYIPSSVGVEIIVEAIKLAMVGGLFVPASSIMAVRHTLGTEGSQQNILSTYFTARQVDVVNSLRRGKANKIIAYELGLQESTVKVHIRNIMKRIKARNRTEVIVKINELTLA